MNPQGLKKKRKRGKKVQRELSVFNQRIIIGEGNGSGGAWLFEGRREVSTSRA